MIWFPKWANGRRQNGSRSFAVFLESANVGLYYKACVRYRWRLESSSSALRSLDPDLLVRNILREKLAAVAKGQRLLDLRTAEDAMNAAIGHELLDGERRLSFKGRVRLVVPRRTRRVARNRAAEEMLLHSVYARETVELELLLNRLTDKKLGPVWWFNRYADAQFSSECTEGKVLSIFGTFEELQGKLHNASINAIEDERLLVRRRVEEIFKAVEDEQSLTLALNVLNRFLDHLGIAKQDNEEAVPNQ